MEKKLLAAGYHKGSGQPSNDADEMYQKTVYGDGKKLYFITIYQYKYGKGIPDGFMIEVFFYVPNGRGGYIRHDVRLHADEFLGIDDFEKHLNELYVKLGAVPDVYNN